MSRIRLAFDLTAAAFALAALLVLHSLASSPPANAAPVTGPDHVVNAPHQSDQRSWSSYTDLSEHLGEG